MKGKINQHKKTDVVINRLDHPFITLTESKIANLWYHDETDELFVLTSRGFKITLCPFHGSKSELFKAVLGCD